MTWKETCDEWLGHFHPDAAPLTEGEWQRCPLPSVMLRYLYAHPNGRKRRLFAVACCRRIAALTPPRFLPLVDVAEDYAEGRASQEQLHHAWGCAWWMMEGDEDTLEEGETAPCEDHDMLTQIENWAAYCVGRVTEPPETYDYPTHAKEDAAAWVSTTAGMAVSYLPEEKIYDDAKSRAESMAQTDLLRDIYGNPFRPIDFSPTWRTPEALQIAQNMYDAGNFDRMPQLGEALRAAGCQEDAVLEHCQSRLPHVRGCWVVDALLGK